MKAKISLDYNNMLQNKISENGIAEDEIKQIQTIAQKHAQYVKDNPLGFMHLPFNQKEVVAEIKAYVDSKKNDIEAVVIFGIGGSALGTIALQKALLHPYYNELDKQDRGGCPKLYVMDNSDPEALAHLFEIIPLEKTLFNIISKSGATAETMSQLMIIKDKVPKDNIVFTTDKEKGVLIKIAKEDGIKTFVVPDGVGGRFSVLCPVGLIPAAFCGMDIDALLDGAAFMHEICTSTDIHENPALMYAVLNYLSMKKDNNICIVMPYVDRLKYIADWYAQLLGESVGKKYDRDGNEIYTGITPVKALGATDQHSQLQLYMEGPFDKFIVFLGVDNYKKTTDIPKIYEDIPEIAYLGGKSQNELIQAQLKSTAYALAKANRPNMTITMPCVDEFNLGQLLNFFQLSVAYMGELLNINAFDQPGVEASKDVVYALFGKPGYEEQKKEFEGV